MNTSYSEYQAGGSLPSGAPTYVERDVDHRIFAALERGQLCYVLNARQMGKSSLRVRTMRRLTEGGAWCSAVDLMLMSEKDIDPSAWFLSFAIRGSSLLGGSSEYSTIQNWNDLSTSNAHKLTMFLDEVLARHPGRAIYIFVDEIDSVLSLPFSDDFFSVIRGLHDAKSDHPEYRRLTFAFFGVATPSELIKDKRRSPFNIGQPFELRGFKSPEALPVLGPGLRAITDRPDDLLLEILAWTGGQPFLTQKLCSLAVSESIAPPVGKAREWISELVRTKVIANWEAQDEPVHLRTIRERILQDFGAHAAPLLTIYQRVLSSEDAVRIDDSLEQMELRLAGLVEQRDSHLVVANRIYAGVFDPEWTAAAIEGLRPYGANLSRWVESRESDADALLQGHSLRQAQEWARGRRLTVEDYRFLTASEKVEKEAVVKANEILAVAGRRVKWTIVTSVIAVLLASTMVIFMQIQAERVRREKQQATERVRKAGLALVELNQGIAVARQQSLDAQADAALEKRRIEAELQKERERMKQESAAAEQRLLTAETRAKEKIASLPFEIHLNAIVDLADEAKVTVTPVSALIPMVEEVPTQRAQRIAALRKVADEADDVAVRSVARYVLYRATKDRHWFDEITRSIVSAEGFEREETALALFVGTNTWSDDEQIAILDALRAALDENDGVDLVEIMVNSGDFVGALPDLAELSPDTFSSFVFAIRTQILDGADPRHLYKAVLAELAPQALLVYVADLIIAAEEGEDVSDLQFIANKLAGPLPFSETPAVADQAAWRRWIDDNADVVAFWKTLNPCDLANADASKYHLALWESPEDVISFPARSRPRSRL
ncbi:MAG TPA: AAA-like domain-containing protein [Thermoanaerobaculia bacterium]|nr:AAA-like domain-containing protein [Thermoanaerobaculia bacterium]